MSWSIGSVLTTDLQDLSYFHSELDAEDQILREIGLNGLGEEVHRAPPARPFMGRDRFDLARVQGKSFDAGMTLDDFERLWAR